MKKTYIYGNSQILAQHAGDHTAARYFYLYDRLGSVRLIMNGSGTVVKDYTYEPFGEVIDSGGTFNNAFTFTGQYFDSEIEEYYLRARQYNPHIGRFTSRDPISGKFKEPLTLHKYLYCMSDPVNRIDPSGEKSLTELTAAMGARATAFGGAAYNFGSAVMQRAQMVYNWAYVKTYELLCIANGIYPSAGSGEQQGFDPLSITPQKLQHIFGNAEHNLGPLLKQYGSSEKDAYIAIQRAVQAGVEAGKYKEGEVVQTVVEVGGVLVKVGGRVMSGVYDLKTAYLWE